MPAAGEIHRLKKRRLLAGFLAGDESVKNNGHFNSSLNRLILIFSRQPNLLATTLVKGQGKGFAPFNNMQTEELKMNLAKCVL